MPFAKNNRHDGEEVNIYYEDRGHGNPVVLIHGWPLSGSMWEYQVTRLLEAGLRCITYDRRGFGKSDYPGDGYDYVTMASDLKVVLDASGAKDVTLVGFSMGGGEIAKYFSAYGGENVKNVILVSTVLPYMMKTEDNPDGVPKDIFDTMAHGIKTDRPSFLHDFNKDFYGVGLIKNPISDAYMNIAVSKAMDSSQYATLKTAESFAATDFREDVPKINVPTLVIHGTADKIVPIEASSNRTIDLLPNGRYKKYEGAPHGLWFTEMDKLSEDIINFAK